MISILVTIKKHRLPLLIIACVAFGMILPQLITKGMILGSDSIFHFNRFYDAAMQIKEHNFQHFISMYGFQQSGRIVNALYGPLFAYFQSLLVLISHSWFGYQVLSRFVLFLLAGFSMYAFLQKGGIRTTLSCGAAIFFLTTFTIQYWTMRQGFSSWGAAVLPLCLLPTIDLAKKLDFNWVQLGVLTALMFQIHVFSSLILIIIYSSFYLYALVKTKQKKQLIQQLIQAIGLFLVLTATLWISYYLVYSGNTVAAPFVNRSMVKSTINNRAVYWLLNPFLLPILLAVQLFIAFFSWKKISALSRLMLGNLFFFLLLSTSLFPWDYLDKQDYTLVNLIQFPFRFFVPVTVFLIFLSAETIQRYFKVTTVYKLIFCSLLILCVGQASFIAYLPMKEWQLNQKLVQAKKKHLFVTTDDSQELKAAAYDKDLTKLLTLIQKSTPDYLPIYEESSSNNYREYERLILNNPQDFNKYVKNHQLYLEWDSQTTEPISLPIIKYTGTKLTLNGTVLTSEDLKLSKIGTVTVTPKVGRNQLAVSYQGNHLLWFPMICSFVAGIWSLIYLGRKKSRELHEN